MKRRKMPDLNTREDVDAYLDKMLAEPLLTLEELQDARAKRERWQRWKHRLIAAVIGVAIGRVIGWLLS